MRRRLGDSHRGGGDAGAQRHGERRCGVGRGRQRRGHAVCLARSVPAALVVPEPESHHVKLEYSGRSEQGSGAGRAFART